MQASNTPTTIKRLITSGNKSDTDLYLAEHAGKVWATNRYWLTASFRVAPLLDKFDIDPKVTGQYEVNGSVRKLGDKPPPQVGQQLNLDVYTLLLERVCVANREVYAHLRDDIYLALFATPDGEHVGIRADWLNWLSDVSAVSAELEPGTHYHNQRLLAKSAHGAVAIVADKRSQTAAARYVDGAWTDAVYEDKGTDILSVVMPTELS